MTHSGAYFGRYLVVFVTLNGGGRTMAAPSSGSSTEVYETGSLLCVARREANTGLKPLIIARESDMTKFIRIIFETYLLNTHGPDMVIYAQL